MQCFLVPERSKTDPKSPAFPISATLAPCSSSPLRAWEETGALQTLHGVMWAWVSNPPWIQAGFEWSISNSPAAPSLLHPVPSIQPIYPVCLTFAHQPWWWRDDHAHLSHHGGAGKTDSFSQKQASSPTADEQLMSCLIFPQAEAKTKWFNFQRAAGIYRGDCERRTSWNWRLTLPSTKIHPCKSPSHQVRLEALKRL